jgi:hypothetical protein
LSGCFIREATPPKPPLPLQYVSVTDGRSLAWTFSDHPGRRTAHRKKSLKIALDEAAGYDKSLVDMRKGSLLAWHVLCH